MKPTLQLTEIRSRRDSARVLRQRSNCPRTDYNFRASSLDDFGVWGGGKPFRSFRGISDEYFEKEARTHFVTEAAFFALIVATVAVPLFQCVRMLVDWVL